MSVRTGIVRMLELLSKAYGRQKWWPADTPFEVCVGAILTQNTSWKNVEKAISRMRKEGLLDASAILNAPAHVLEDAIRPAGFYKQKAQRLKHFCTHTYFNGISQMSLQDARAHLLSLKGIGRETADSILLYAFGKPIFVVDAYTKRIYGRVFEGKDSTALSYEEVRTVFEKALGKNTRKLNEMHALLVEHAKLHCKKSFPKCQGCPLLKMCNFGRNQA
ncbi:MAG: endonuclease [Candidatus Micrarchaeota archaeon]|nr:endonuclease [Candidatus Micrarchaeota archaeon]